MLELYTVRDLMYMSEDEIWSLPKPGQIIVRFDDGVEITTDTVNVMIGSWYLWKIAANWEEVKVNSTLFINDAVFTDKLFRELLWDAVEATINLDIPKEDVWLLAQQLYNESYNAIVTRCHRNISTTGYSDITQLLEDKEIKAANNQVTDALPTIDRAHATIEQVLRSKRYRRNPIVRAVMNSTVKVEQILQSIGPRGRTTDIDSVIYTIPVKRGFAQGLGSLDAYAMESRSAAKALLFNKDPVAAAEYFNRKMQLACAVIRELVPGDCGTHDSHEFKIPNDKYGKKMIQSLSGLYEVVNEKGKDVLREIRDKDFHLLGKTIRFRSSLCCKHAPQQRICETCYGMTSYGIPQDTNPGHVSSTSINEPTTQIIISTKHLDFIVHQFIAILSEREKEYLEIRDKDDELYLKSFKGRTNIWMAFQAKDAPGLVDVNYATKISDMDVARVSSIGQVSFYLLDETTGATAQEQVFDMVKCGTHASLSPAALQYIHRNSWERDGGWFHINLGKWSYKHPLFVYQHRHENMSEFASRLETFIRSAKSDMDEDGQPMPTSSSRGTRHRAPMLATYRDVDLALWDTYFLMSEKLKGLHMGHIATVLTATRVNDTRVGDWSMPSGKQGGVFRSHDEIIRHRSLGVAMLFERQSEVFTDPSAYLETVRLSSIMDDLIYIPDGKYK